VDNMEMHLKETGHEDLVRSQLAHDGPQMRDFVNTIMNFRVL